MKWFAGSVALAIQVSKKNNALLVVFIESPCEKGTEMKELWDQIEPTLFPCPIVGIHLKKGETATRQFSEIYPTPILPASYFIDHVGKPMEIVTMLEDLDYDKFYTKIQKTVKKFMEICPQTPAASEIVQVTAEAGNNVATSSQTQQLSMDEKIKRAKELLEQKHRNEEERKKQEEHAKELERIQSGKLMQDAQKKRQEKELIDAAAERRRDKIMAEAEKERVKAQIRADREEREYRLNRQAGGTNTAPPKPASGDSQPAKPVASDRCRVQVKFPDGSTMIEEFSSKDSLNTLVTLIREDNRVDGLFTVAQSYPRKVFTTEDYEKSYLDLCLTPNCTLLVLQTRPSTSQVVSASPFGGIINIFSLLILSPITLILSRVWSVVASSFGIGRDNSKKNDETSTPAATKPQATSNSGERRRGVPEGAIIRQRGNVTGLHNTNGTDSEPEENPNWNGNSTQFL